MERFERFEKKITVQEACYYGFFILLSLAKGLGFYEGQKLFYLLVAPALVLGLLKILLTPYTKRQAVLQILFMVLVAVIYYESRQIAIFFVAFTVLGMKNISLKKVFHIALWVWTVCAVVLSSVSFFFLEHTVYRVHQKLGMGHIFRWSLGFTHPNILHITYLMLCALAIWELEEKYGFKQYALLMIGNLLVFFYSISYTGFGIVAVMLTGCLYIKFRPRFCLAEKALANLVLPVCLLMSFVLPFYLSWHKISHFVEKINFMVNTRIWLAEQFLKSEYRSLFGADVSKIVRSSMTLDNSYVWCYINYGLIPTIIILSGYFILLFYDTHKQRTRELVILVCFLGAGWTEQLLFNTSFKNITLLFLGALLFRPREGEAEYGLHSLIPSKWRQVTVPLSGMPDQMFFYVRAWCRGHRGAVFCATFAGAVLGALLCAMLYREPAGYVVPRFYTDGLEETSVYLESADDPAYEGYRVMNYQDAGTPMQIVAGEAVKLETARYYVGSVLIGALLGAAVCLCGGAFRKKAAFAVTEISGYDK